MKKKKGFLSRIQAFMDSPKGKTILNYLYSWGAAIVILGTLFKLTHMEGANLMLFVGMGTEVIVFFFSAFERPYEIAEEEQKEEERVSAPAYSGGGQPIIIGGPITAGIIPEQTGGAVSDTPMPQPVIVGAGAPPQTGAVAQGGNIPAVNVENVNEMEQAIEQYVEQIRALNEAFQRITQQTDTLSRNMEELDTLGRNLTGVNALYEVQLRSAGGQLGAIDQINEQTQKMAKQIEELNSIYARMIDAMTSNMNRSQI